MVVLNQKYLLFIFMLFTFVMHSQRHLRTEVSFNKRSVYVGEPMEVSVTVYSSTWFTEGVDPGNIKINGAYTVYFRSLSSSKTFDNKLYSGVTLFFNVFPYNEENVEFPSLEFVVETPDEGNYVGVKRKIKTRAKQIIVKPVPPGIKKDAWLVSSSVRVYDSWKGDLTKVKVGDVLERNITLKVNGTISELIPRIQFDTIPKISLYPKRSYLKNNKSKTAISAQRTDGTRYLFEKEGSITIPEIVVYWWNPRYSKLYKRILKSKTIQVAANPDLGMLESVKKTLEETVETEEEVDEKLLVFGLSLKKFMMFLSGSILLLFIVIRVGIKLYRKLKNSHLAYKESEQYYFKCFIKSKNETTLYKWIDQLNLKEPSVNFIIMSFGTKSLIEKYSTLHNKEKNLSRCFKMTSDWKKTRKNFLNSKKVASSSNSDWVNP